MISVSCPLHSSKYRTQRNFHKYSVLGNYNKDLDCKIGEFQYLLGSRALGAGWLAWLFVAGTAFRRLAELCLDLGTSSGSDPSQLRQSSTQALPTAYCCYAFAWFGPRASGWSIYTGAHCSAQSSRSMHARRTGEAGCRRRREKTEQE